MNISDFITVSINFYVSDELFTHLRGIIEILLNEILKTSAADSYFSAAVVVYSIENLQIKVCVASNLTQ